MSKSNWDRTDEQWEALEYAGWDFLVDRARNGWVTTYTEMNAVLQNRTGQPMWNFDSQLGRAAMGELLGRLSDRSWDECHVMISAIVKYLNEAEPGPGFYGKAVMLGLLTAGASKEEKDRVWTEQMNAVAAHWGRPRAAAY
jgi:hypothetical protein